MAAWIGLLRLDDSVRGVQWPAARSEARCVDRRVREKLTMKLSETS